MSLPNPIPDSTTYIFYIETKHLTQAYKSEEH
jgi:hypothetical protein